MIAFVGCTNDYEQFDSAAGVAGGSAGSLPQHDSGSDRSATGTGGSDDTGSAPADAGEESADVSAEAVVDASDAQSDSEAPVEAPVDAPADSSERRAGGCC